MIKNAITFALIFIMIFSFTQNCFASGDHITIVLNGESVTTDVDPFISAGRTMVPARAVFEKMGAYVSWDGMQNRVTVTGTGIVINLTIGNSVATVNGEAKQLDSAPVIVDGRTFVPLRFISENLGYSVEWNELNKIVYIFSASGGSQPSNGNQNSNDTKSEVVPQTPTQSDSNGTQGSPAILNSVNVSEIAGGVEVCVELSSNVSPRIMTLDNPRRIVFDFYGIVQNFKNSSYKPLSDTISDVRWGRHDDYARIVVECKTALNYNVKYNNKGCVITVSDTLSFSDAGTLNDGNADIKSETVPSLQQQPVYITGNPLVYIDPGHGGHDSGAIGRDENGNVVVIEKEANLTISLKVRDLLASSGVDVRMTRDSDVALGSTQMEDLVTRASLANEANALLYVSIHNNSFGDSSATGTTVLYAGLSSAGDYGITGEQLAQNIQNSLVKATGLRDRGIVKSPEMVVLRRTAMPAVIVECAFVSCPVDQKVLTDPARIDAIAYAIYEGIMTSLNQSKQN